MGYTWPPSGHNVFIVWLVASFSRGGTGCSIIDQFPSAIFYQPLFPSRDFMRLYWLFIKRYGVLFFSMPECCSFSSVLFRFFSQRRQLRSVENCLSSQTQHWRAKVTPPPQKKKQEKRKITCAVRVPLAVTIVRRRRHGTRSPHGHCVADSFSAWHCLDGGVKKDVWLSEVGIVFDRRSCSSKRDSPGPGAVASSFIFGRPCPFVHWRRSRRRMRRVPKPERLSSGF